MATEITIHELLASAPETPLLERQLILAHVLGKTRSWVIGHDQDSVCELANSVYEKRLERRIHGEPVAYILGHKDFWKHRFAVNKATLIPRPETELLVETALAAFPDTTKTVLDLGTGCGAIAISLANERPAWQVIASDLSASSLAVAKRNAQGTPNIRFFQGNWGEAIKPRSVELIICNPPYIEPGDEHLSALVFEPSSALVSPCKGLHDLHTVIKEARDLLADGGTLLLEHGYNQQDALCKRLHNHGFTHIETYSDLNQTPRAISAQLG
ncbi:MAG TPA: peptide chain release factor N(5)-glutamine methyltransferase [Gammaproteobacteria bacterium]|nr:peptide chain release factor N(5)-glutamine methyltransferase [Gammaproteobacteria bacterium]